MTDIRRQAIQTVERYRMIEPWSPLVLAVSGGADSVAMLRLLLELSGRELPAFEGHVAHLEHGVRGRESERDAEFVRELARDLGMEFHLRRRDVPQLAKTLSVGVEEAGRRERYAFFAEVAQRVGARRVATAHHADDNVETVLMRVARGMTHRSLAGIPPVRPIASGSRVMVARPLIDCRRRGIERYLGEIGQEFRDDATNLGLDTLRNRIRHQVIPRLENRMAPGMSASILESIRAFRRSRRGLTIQALELIQSGPVRLEETRVQFQAAWLDALPRLIASEAVHQMLLRLVPETDKLTIAHHEAVLRLARRDRSTGETRLPGGVTARREYDQVDLFTEEDTAPDGETPVPLANGEVELPAFKGRLSVLVRDEAAEALPGFLRRQRPNTALLDAERLKGSVSIRPWRAGDRMRPLGSPGEKKLQDIFTDRKAPRSERHRTPILCVNGQPVWIVGHVMDESAKVTPRTAKAVEFVFSKR